SAFLDGQLSGVGGDPAGVPADRPRAACFFNRLDRELHVASLFGDADLLVVDPAPAMARDLVAGLGHGAGAVGIARDRHADGIAGEVQLARRERTQDAPESGAAAVLVDRLDGFVAPAGSRR